MSFLIRKRVNAKPYIDERAKLYVQKGRKKKKHGKMLATRPTRAGNEKQ